MILHAAYQKSLNTWEVEWALDLIQFNYIYIEVTLDSIRELMNLWPLF